MLKETELGENGIKNIADIIDFEDTRKLDSQRLLDPSATSDNLKEFAFGVGCPCPTRTMTRETSIALRQLSYPMFGNPIHYSPDSQEVGEARNTIVQQALDDGVEWLFFLDYDVAPPPNALVKLLKLNVDIAAGVYHSKSVPSWPLIQVKGWKYAFEDYEYGDLIKAEGVGMGCTLIKMDVFRKIEKECGKPWFKTVPGYSTNSSEILPQLTEDIYFCQKAHQCGYDIIVDTAVQCGHVDWKTGMIFHYVQDPNNSKKGLPGWTYRTKDGLYTTEYTADAHHPNRKWAEVYEEKEVDLGLDLGCGGKVKKGYRGIDLHCKGKDIISGDIKDLKWYRKEYGKVPKIYAAHVLEHFSHRDVPIIFRDWVNTLKPGGEMEVRVPDLEYHIDRIKDAILSGDDQDKNTKYWIETLFGWQIGDGQDHRSGFTEKRLKQLGLTSGLVGVKVGKKMNDGQDGMIGPNQELILTGKRGK